MSKTAQQLQLTAVFVQPYSYILYKSSRMISVDEDCIRVTALGAMCRTWIGLKIPAKIIIADILPTS